MEIPRDLAADVTVSRELQSVPYILILETPFDLMKVISLRTLEASLHELSLLYGEYTKAVGAALRSPEDAVVEEAAEDVAAEEVAAEEVAAEEVVSVEVVAVEVAAVDVVSTVVEVKGADEEEAAACSL